MYNDVIRPERDRTERALRSDFWLVRAKTELTKSSGRARSSTTTSEASEERRSFQSGKLKSFIKRITISNSEKYEGGIKMQITKKLEEYDDVKILSEDVQKTLDSLAFMLQREIKSVHATGWRTDGGEYRARGLEKALEYLNYHFRTDYETDIGKITTNDLRPIRQERQ